MPNIAYINGRFMLLSRSKVSVEDRGFQFGDGIYEVIRTYHLRLFQVDAHLERLERSAAAIGLDPVYSKSRWKGILNELNKRCGYKEAKLYVQLTRGVAPRDHAFPVKSNITVVMTARRLVQPTPVLRRRGVAVITVPDIRWNRCDIKSINLLPNVMARQKAKAARAYEALFVRTGCVTEGAVSNIFAWVGGRLVTPPVGSRILSGITRECVLRLAKEAGLPTVERDLPLEELLSAEEVFLTGTTLEILPVVKLNGQSIGIGKPGNTTKKIYKLFQDVTRE
jgi:D-alanine transaminase